MGFHVCQFCEKSGRVKDNHAFSPLSSADVMIVFENGKAFVFPDTGLRHYITSHKFMPPPEFIEAVMNSRVVGGHGFAQTKTAIDYVRVGYLTEATFSTGDVPSGFMEKLGMIIEEARGAGSYQQTRGAYRATRGI